jgi:hypothetical protein
MIRRTLTLTAAAAPWAPRGPCAGIVDPSQKASTGAASLPTAIAGSERPETPGCQATPRKPKEPSGLAAPSAIG